MQQARKRDIFTTVRTEGGLLPADILERISAGGSGLDGLDTASFHLAPGEKISEAISRAWNRLLGYWETFRASVEKLPDSDTGTGLTRDRWMLPLFQELGYGRLQRAGSLDVDDKTYPISHLWGRVPIHLVGFRVPLDRRTQGVAGAAQTAPHGMVQELLNASDDHLWAFVSNGRRLRLLRDNKALTRQAYVEFDLEAMFEGEVYPDFILLWLLCHQSRVEAEHPSDFWLEKWSQAAQQEGIRALDALREGVEKAIVALGSGFISHPANRELREKLKTQGGLSAQDYYRQLLRLVYRLLFLFVAEDRDLLLLPDADPAARERYIRFYATTRLRRLSEKQRGTRHGDLWAGLSQILGHLYGGYPALALPALGSFLFRADAIADLAGCELANHALLDTMRSLCQLRDGNVTRSVSFKNLQTEELGSVYEALLELHPEMNVDAGAFTLKTVSGNERKTTGSYYTPDSLVQCLLDSALDPVLDEAVKQFNPEKAILALTVCDPACGSGHFLIAAAHRMAKRLAYVRTGDSEPAPEETNKALRDIIGRCLYGMDINPMAVELCKVALWMEALVPGKPLSFLEHHIQCGNALLGTTPDLMAQGIPDDAFTPIERDERAYCATYKKQNKKEREARAKREAAAKAGQTNLFRVRLGNLAGEFARLTTETDDRPEELKAKEEHYARLVNSQDYLYGHFLADAWCAAFVWNKYPGLFNYPITEEIYRRIEETPHWAEGWLRDEVKRLAGQYAFMHWHLTFPEVFGVAGESGGFSALLGNPPWERVKLQEKEWFSVRRPDIANATNASKRRDMIEGLKTEDPALYMAFLDDRRQAEGESHLLRHSGRFPLCGRGDVNTYAVFAEMFRSLLGTTGRAGIVVPSGIATDDTTKFFFQDLNGRHSLASLFEFENEGFFPGAGSGHMNRFCLLTMLGVELPAHFADFVFQGKAIQELTDPERHFTLTPEEVKLLNPNTQTCPIFRTRRDAEITKGVYRRVPVLVAEDRDDGNLWSIEFMAMFHMSNDSGLFKQKHELADPVPLYESKMLYLFNHRYGDYGMLPQGERGHILPSVPIECLAEASYSIKSYYWVEKREVADRLVKRDRDGNVVWQWQHQWLLGFRGIADSRASARTLIAGLTPYVGTGNGLPLILPISADVQSIACFFANLCAFSLDYIVRQKIAGNNMNLFYVSQLPIMPPHRYSHSSTWSTTRTLSDWIVPRVLELTYTAHDMTPFANDCGYDGKPFRWDEERRFLLRCELDAAYFHLYGINHDDVDYIMDTFPVVRRKDEVANGEYRTKRVILEIYDEMAAGCYETRLSPPPANGWTTPVHLLPPSNNVEPTASVPVEPEPPIPSVPADTADEIELPTHKAPTPKANIFFQRSVLGAEIVSQMYQQRSFGHVKFMKTFEICELDADLEDLETQYYRQAAGPLDRKLLFSLDQQMERQRWFKADRQEGRVVYVPMEKAGQHQEYFDRYWGAKRDVLNRIIRLFAPLNTRQAEIVATLYTAWNDLLLAGEQPDDADVVRESRDKWHKEKEKIVPDEWAWGLRWMRQNQLLPRGTGQRTRTMPTGKTKSSARTKRKVSTPTKNTEVIEAASQQPVAPIAGSSSQPDDGFELVSPETKKRKTAQQHLDIPDVPQQPRTSGLPQPLMRVRLNGQAATVYAIEPAGEATRYTVVVDGERAPRTFQVPPARIERLES